MQAFRDVESADAEHNTDSGMGTEKLAKTIQTIAAKELSGPHHITDLSIASAYALSRKIIERLRRPEFVANPYGNIFNLLSNMESLFPNGHSLQQTIKNEVSIPERSALVYGLFFLHIDRTYFRHKTVRVPETILDFLRREDTQIQSLRFLKESLSRHGHQNQHLESAFCLLAADDSYEIAELVGESARDPERGTGASQSRMALSRLEDDIKKSVHDLRNEFARITRQGSKARAGVGNELSEFLLRADLLVGRFSAFLDIMNWSMAPYADEPAHRPFIFLLRNHIDSMESAVAELLNIVATIAGQYPAGAARSNSRHGKLVTLLQIRTHWIRYTLSKLRLNTAPILFEHEVQKRGGKTAENLALYRRDIGKFDQRVALAYEDLSSISTLCEELSTREASPGSEPRSRVAERVDQTIGEAEASLGQERGRAERER